MWLENFIRKSIKDVEPYKPGKSIGELKRELGLRHVVRLCSNENPWPLPESVIRAIQEASCEVNRYPDAEAYSLRKAIAKKLGVSVQEVIVGAGTEGVVFALFQALLEEDDDVVILKPTYPLYKLATLACGSKCIEVPVDHDFRVSVTDLMNACTDKTKLLVLCDPNNPTGLFLPRHDLLTLSAFLNKKNILLVVDEAYAEFVTDPEYLSGIELFRQIGNVVILRTFSKIYGLAGLRVGYGIVPKPITKAYEKVRRVFDVNSIAQAAAIAALKEDDYIQDIREKTLLEKEKVTRALISMGMEVSETFTNFILVKVDDEQGMYDGLLKEGIIVRPASDLGLKGYLRVSIGMPEENEQFISTLRKLMRRLGRRI